MSQSTSTTTTSTSNNNNVQGITTTNQVNAQGTPKPSQTLQPFVSLANKPVTTSSSSPTTVKPNTPSYIPQGLDMTGFGEIDPHKIRLYAVSSEKKDQLPELLEYIGDRVNATKCFSWKNGMGELALSDSTKELRKQVEDALEGFCKYTVYRNIGTKRQTVSIGFQFPTLVTALNMTSITEELEELTQTIFLSFSTGQNWAIAGIHDLQAWDRIMSTEVYSLPKNNNIKAATFAPNNQFNYEENYLIATNPPSKLSIVEYKHQLEQKGIPILQILKLKFNATYLFKNALLIYLPNAVHLQRLKDINYCEMEGEIQYFAFDIHDANQNGTSEALCQHRFSLSAAPTYDPNSISKIVRTPNNTMDSFCISHTALDKVRDEIINQMQVAINHSETKIVARLTSIFKQSIPFTKDDILHLQHSLDDLTSWSYKFEESMREDIGEDFQTSPKRKRPDDEMNDEQYE